MYLFLDDVFPGLPYGYFDVPACMCGPEEILVGGDVGAGLVFGGDALVVPEGAAAAEVGVERLRHGQSMFLVLVFLTESSRDCPCMVFISVMVFPLWWKKR